MAATGVLVVTDDFRLSNVLSGLGYDAININHIRSQAWF
jgi:rRNA maturation endonuclease Nob1